MNYIILVTVILSSIAIQCYTDHTIITNCNYSCVFFISFNFLFNFLLFLFIPRTRFLDSRTLSRLGVYIPKADLNTFFVNEENTEQRNDGKQCDALSTDIYWNISICQLMFRCCMYTVTSQL